ncbi:MAG: methyltransferase domain-containing protein [Alphaproteobacteria bacterium]|nr:methyltransferase domain-containing protein [Alphaproteobacteria bacterium]
MSSAQEYWEKAHKAGYDDVFSLTEDEALRTRIVSELASDVQNILIPGCGSRGHLEKHIAQAFPRAQIICTDFPKVVEIAKDKNGDIKNVEYRVCDSVSVHELPEKFDAVIIVNAVVSGENQENVEMVKSSLQALRAGGQLIGFFPTIFCALDISYRASMPGIRSCIDLETSTFHDPVQKEGQIFYTPLQLRQIFQAAGYQQARIEIYYLDTPHFEAEAERLYGVDSRNTPLYQHLVLARAP